MRVKVPGSWAELRRRSTSHCQSACCLLGLVAVVSLLTCGCQSCQCYHTLSQIKGTLRAGSARGMLLLSSKMFKGLQLTALLKFAKLRYYWNNTSGRSQWQRPVESETDANSGSRVTTPTTPAVKEASQQLQQLQQLQP